MSTFKWVAPESIQTALDTGLNSLGNGNTALSSAIANQTDLYLYISLELYLNTINPTGSPYVQIYFILSPDESNYEDGTAGTPGTIPARQPDAIFALRAANAAQRVALSNIPIPPLPFKLLLVNNTGVAFNASSNTLKYRRHNSQGV